MVFFGFFLGWFGGCERDLGVGFVRLFFFGPFLDVTVLGNWAGSGHLDLCM